MGDFKLRAIEPSDVDAIYALENSADVERASWNNAPVSRHLLVNYAFGYSADIFRDGQLRLVIECDGEFAGTVDVTDVDASAGHALIGLAVLPKYRRMGLGLKAVNAASDFCRSVGLHQLCAIVARDNSASLSLFASAGFSTSGCLRSWLRRGKSYQDAIILQKIL